MVPVLCLWVREKSVVNGLSCTTEVQYDSKSPILQGETTPLSHRETKCFIRKENKLQRKYMYNTNILFPTSTLMIYMILCAPTFSLVSANGDVKNLGFISILREMAPNAETSFWLTAGCYCFRGRWLDLSSLKPRRDMSLRSRSSASRLARSSGVEFYLSLVYLK